MNHRNYTTSEAILKSITIALIIVAVIVWGMVIYQKVTTPSPWIGSYPMANQHIQFTYAKPIY